MADDSDETLSSAQPSPEQGEKGQRLVLYIPQGAVIVERLGANEGGEQSDADVEPTGKSDPPKSVTVSDGSVGSPADSSAGQPVTSFRSTDELRLMYQIAQTLDEVTKRLDQGKQLEVSAPSIQLSEPFIASPQPELLVEEDGGEPSIPAVCKVEHHIRWIHTINVTFVAMITVLALIPGALATFFGLTLYSAHQSSFAGAIHKGDLMISRLMPVSQLAINDLILVRQPSTWTFGVRKVKDITMTKGGATTTLTTETDKGLGSRDVLSSSSTAISHKVTRVIPAFGSVQDAFNSIFIRAGVGIFLLSLNLLAHIRRRSRQLAAN